MFPSARVPLALGVWFVGLRGFWSTCGRARGGKIAPVGRLCARAPNGPHAIPSVLWAGEDASFVCCQLFLCRLPFEGNSSGCFVPFRPMLLEGFWRTAKRL